MAAEMAKGGPVAEPDSASPVLSAAPLVPSIAPVTLQEPVAPAASTTAWGEQSGRDVQLAPPDESLDDAMGLLTRPTQASAPAVAPAARAPSTPNRQKEKEREVDALLRGAKDLLELDDHSGAIDLILKAEQLAPQDPRVLGLKVRSEQTLQAMFESKIGRLDSKPRVILKEDEIIWLNLDHRAGFVLAQIDGTVSFEDLFSVSGMSRLDTVRILAQLVEQGVISAG
jgi:hypothetical protein